jgi:thiamine pyrophosphokinase
VFDYDSPEEAEQEVINAVHYCLHLLQKNKYITDHVIAFQRAQKKEEMG